VDLDKNTIVACTCSPICSHCFFLTNVYKSIFRNNYFIWTWIRFIHRCVQAVKLVMTYLRRWNTHASLALRLTLVTAVSTGICRRGRWRLIWLQPAVDSSVAPSRVDRDAGLWYGLTNRPGELRTVSGTYSYRVRPSPIRHIPDSWSGDPHTLVFPFFDGRIPSRLYHGWASIESERTYRASPLYPQTRSRL